MMEIENLDLFIIDTAINKLKFKDEIIDYESVLMALEVKNNSYKTKKLINQIKTKCENLPSRYNNNQIDLVCRFCHKSIEMNSFIRHIQLFHLNRSTNEIKEELKQGRLTINSHFSEKYLKNENEQIERKYSQLEEKYLQIKNNIKLLKSMPFFEKTEIFITTMEMIDSNLISTINSHKENLLNIVFKVILNNMEKDLPDKLTYIKENCKTIYVTWEDLYFDYKKLKIKCSKGIFQPIDLGGALKILNEIKESYFQRHYKKDVYILRFSNGFINEIVSPDLKKIRKRIQQAETQIYNRDLTNLTDIREIDQTQLIQQIDSGKIKNTYLRIPAELLSKKDKLYALLENNNNSLEQCILFIFYRNNQRYILWENYNYNRAGYIFLISGSNYDEEFNNIKKLVINNIDYKRLNLWYGVNLGKVFNICSSKYWSLVHHSEAEYKLKLNRILSWS